MDEVVHFAKGPKMFDAACGVWGNYMTPHWHHVSCKACLNTMTPRNRELMEQWKKDNIKI